MISKSDDRRIYWIDGLKGLCCIGVFIHHFFLKYAPESYYGSIDYHVQTFTSYFAYTPLGIFINGNFFVFIFIFLSGIVIARKIYFTDYHKVGNFLIYRYFKLSIPLLFVEILYLFFYKMKIGGTVLSADDGIDSILQVFENSLIRIPRYGDTTFAGAFWMLNIIHIGGLLVTAIATVSWSNTKTATFIFVICSLALFSQKDFYYSTLFFGSAYGLLYSEKKCETRLIPLWVCVFLIALFLGAFPSGIIPKSGIYQYLLLNGNWHESSYLVYHWTAVILLVVSISNLAIIKKILEWDIIITFGGFSYIFYVFHNFIRKVMDPLYWIIIHNFNNRALAITLNLIIQFIILCIICFVYSKSISKIEIHIKNAISKYM